MRRLAVGFVLLLAVAGLSVSATAATGELDRAPTAVATHAIGPMQGSRCSALRRKLAVAKRKRQRARVRALTRSLKQCLRKPRPPAPPPPAPAPQPPPPPASHAPGQSTIFPANCKYGSAPYPGYLRVSTRPPNVTGTPSRLGAEWVRYAAWLVDLAGNTVQVTPWSGWLSAGEGAWATWTGETSFTADWRGNYRIDLRIEWWDQSSRLAWQAHRITAYYYFDEWNTAWGGPFPSCMRQPV
jgi:hypothetical protein